MSNTKCRICITKYNLPQWPAECYCDLRSNVGKPFCQDLRICCQLIPAVTAVQ